jgi:Flavin reductase like domain
MGGVGAHFDELVGELDYPMYIVTTSVAGANVGCLVGFATQVSINPPRLLVCLSEKNHTTTVAIAATHLAVHLIHANDGELAHLFGEQTGDQIDKFTRCRWSVGPHELPILDDAAAWFVGRIEKRIDFGASQLRRRARIRPRSRPLSTPAGQPASWLRAAARRLRSAVPTSSAVAIAVSGATRTQIRVTPTSDPCWLAVRTP